MRGWAPWCSPRWFARRFGVDILLRISAVLGIQKVLRILLGREEDERAWRLQAKSGIRMQEIESSHIP